MGRDVMWRFGAAGWDLVWSGVEAQGDQQRWPQHGDSRTRTAARGPGVAGTALKGRMEVVNGLL